MKWKKTRSYMDFFDPYFSIRIIYSVPLYDHRHLLPDNLIDSLWIINTICFVDCFFSIIRFRFIRWKMNKEMNVLRSCRWKILDWRIQRLMIAKISCLKILKYRNRKATMDAVISSLNINFKIFVSNFYSFSSK